MTELNNGIQNGAQEVSKLMLKAVFWDMDGTLIDSEPYWHEGELKIAADHGGYWDEDLAWQGSGTPVPDVARRMVEHGCKLSIEEIGKGMIDYVAQKEFERIPWIDGVEDVLLSLKEAGVPSMLVTTSPRHLAENLIAQAPDGTFAGYVCGDDDVEKKPSPAPYLAAGRKLGIAPEDMKYCIAVEDSMSGLRSAAASGATTLGQTGFMRIDNSNGPQFASINGYDGITAATLDATSAAATPDAAVIKSRNAGNCGNKRKSPLRWNECSGLRGADGSRNRDLFDANEALYQLSYSPMCVTLFSKTTLEILVRSVEKCNSTLRVLCLRCIRRYFYDD